MNPARHVSRSIACSKQQAYDYISDPMNLPNWASGPSSSIKKIDGKWVADSPMGKVSIEFVGKNDFGVLDHDVSVDSGEIFPNPFRVIPNGKDCELIFSVIQRDGMSDQEFKDDVKHIEDDLMALKKILESASNTGKI